MSKAELLAQISELERAADALDEPDRSLKKMEVAGLRIKVAGMALDDIADKFKPSLPEIADMRAKIAAAKDATKAHNERVKLFDQALGVIKTGLKVLT